MKLDLFFTPKNTTHCDQKVIDMCNALQNVLNQYDLSDKEIRQFLVYSSFSEFIDRNLVDDRDALDAGFDYEDIPSADNPVAIETFKHFWTDRDK